MSIEAIADLIKDMSVPDLETLALLIPREIKRKRELERHNVLAEIEQLAKARGFSVQELVAPGTKTASRAQVVAKYRSLSNPEQTWTGRGRQPVWVREFIASGGTIDQLLIR